MADTNFGVNHALARKLWSKSLFREVLKETSVGRFTGEGTNNVIQILPDTQKEAGDRVRVGLRMQLTGAGVSGDNTLEGNEESLTYYSDDVTIDQLRHAVRSNGRASEQRVPYETRAEARSALTDWLAGRIDEAFFNQIAGNTAQSDVRYSGMQATVAPSSSFIIYGGSEDSEGSLSASTTHAITLRDIDAAVATAKTASPKIRPIRMKGEEYYVCYMHTYQIHQLRGQTATAQWADIQRAALQGGQITSNPLFTGAAGMWNNVIIHESTRLPNIVDTPNSGATTDYRRAVFCGAQAAAMCFGRDNDFNRATWEEETFDYGNKLGVAGGLIWGLKKLQFNSTDFATIVLSGYAPAP